MDQTPPKPRYLLSRMAIKAGYATYDQVGIPAMAIMYVCAPARAFADAAGEARVYLLVPSFDEFHQREKLTPRSVLPLWAWYQAIENYKKRQKQNPRAYANSPKIESTVALLALQP